MRKCPFCNADIEENARFCLYCMTSLEEKETIAAVPGKKKPFSLLWLLCLLPIAIALCLLLWQPAPEPPEITPPDRLAVPTESTIPPEGGTLPPEQTEPETKTPSETSPSFIPEWLQSILPGNTKPTGSLAPATTVPPATFPSSTEPSGTVPQSTQPPATLPQDTQPPATLPQDTQPQATEPSATEAPTEAPTEPEIVEPDYGNGIPGTEGYRTKLSIQNPGPEGDDMWAFVPLGENPIPSYTPANARNMNDPNYVNPGNEYVATSGSGISRNGIVEVPSHTPDGGIYVGIECLEEVVKVTLSATIRYIGEEALYHWRSELKYLYIKSEVIDIHENAFPPMERRMYTIELCTSATCRNTKGEYYKDIAHRYGVVWKEWNG